jgi:hypothetical protein
MTEVDVDLTLTVPCTKGSCTEKATVMVTFGCHPDHQAPYCDACLRRIIDNGHSASVLGAVECLVHDRRCPYPLAGWRPL